MSKNMLTYLDCTACRETVLSFGHGSDSDVCVDKSTRRRRACGRAVGNRFDISMSYTFVAIRPPADHKLTNEIGTCLCPWCQPPKCTLLILPYSVASMLQLGKAWTMHTTRIGRSRGNVRRMRLWTAFSYQRPQQHRHRLSHLSSEPAAEPNNKRSVHGCSTRLAQWVQANLTS